MQYVLNMLSLVSEPLRFQTMRMTAVFDIVS